MFYFNKGSNFKINVQTWASLLGSKIFDFGSQYHKTPKYLDTQTIAVIMIKFEQGGGLYH